MSTHAAHFATQREEDAALRRPLDAKMIEDPDKRGIPLFLQVQNRRPPTKKQLAALERRMRAAAPADPNADRVDFRKPASMAWETWDAIQAAEADKRRAAAEVRIAALKAKQVVREARPPRLPGYKGHIAGSRKEQVHRCFDSRGLEPALKLAEELGLKHGTAFSWAKAWAKDAPEQPAAGKAGKSKPVGFRKGRIAVEKKEK
jgi:hypothetical protein